MHGDSVDFTILDPREKVIYEKRDSDGYELEQKIHIGGDYGFCFSNNARAPTGVHFEYDFHLGRYGYPRDHRTFFVRYGCLKDVFCTLWVSQRRFLYVMDVSNTSFVPYGCLKE